MVGIERQTPTVAGICGHLNCFLAKSPSLSSRTTENFGESSVYFAAIATFWYCAPDLTRPLRILILASGKVSDLNQGVFGRPNDTLAPPKNWPRQKHSRDLKRCISLPAFQLSHR